MGLVAGHRIAGIPAGHVFPHQSLHQVIGLADHSGSSVFLWPVSLFIAVKTRAYLFRPAGQQFIKKGSRLPDFPLNQSPVNQQISQLDSAFRFFLDHLDLEFVVLFRDADMAAVFEFAEQ